jgi:type I restriction enzyme S subunit
LIFLRSAYVKFAHADEQKHIVIYLESLQAKVSALRRAQADSEKEPAALMPSILDKAFKGEL